MVKLVTVFVFFPLISAQDAGLDALAAVISRQKIMGQEIGNELDEQNGKVLCVCVCTYSSNSRHITQHSVKAVSHTSLLQWNYLPHGH